MRTDVCSNGIAVVDDAAARLGAAVRVDDPAAEPHRGVADQRVDPRAADEDLAEPAEIGAAAHEPLEHASGTSATCAPRGASASKAPGSNRSSTVMWEPVTTPRR